MIRRSILFNAVEALWVSEGLPQALSILDVAGEVADAGVEDIVEGVLSKEDVADHPHALSNHRVRPQAAQIGYGVYDLLLDAHALQKVLVAHIVSGEEETHLLIVPFDETDDTLSEVFGYVLGLVLQPSFHPASPLTFL